MHIEPFPDIAPKAATSRLAHWTCVLTSALLFILPIHIFLCLLDFFVGHLISPFLIENARFRTFILVVLIYVILTFIIGSFRKVPWFSLAPIFIAILWKALLFIPLPGIYSNKTIDLLGTILLLGAWAITLIQNRARFGNWLIPESLFEPMHFSFRRTLLTMSLKLFVFLPAGVIGIVLSLCLMTDWRTKGFVQLRKEGLSTQSRIYKRDNHYVYLLPTSPIASPNFYQKLFDKIPVTDAVLLPESISDKKNILKGLFNYNQVANSIELTSLTDFSREIPLPIPVQKEETDISDFSPKTQLFMQVCANTLSSPTKDGMLKLWTTLQELPEEDWKMLKYDIIDSRNVMVSNGIQEALPRYHHIVVPWTVLHMPGIEKELQQAGFQQTSARETLVFEWKIIFPNLWKQSVKPTLP